ncbi:ferrous iron transport protein B [archaeon]|jgi:ferrous iron transport protein B|nr:ferrous iron transport protein B [archaeon]MBT4647324.1 ferrous iron transport protein B [archaeon]MBT6821240.1 ferrous iron transport protein B [archaeon]MBT7391292.1 ferrous iron transport protein B [archaeon]
MNKINVAIVGNPNSGKSTLFSTLTGFHQEVGNWPGKTIEKKEGCTCFRNQKINFVDLPGIYSLNTDTQEEKIAKKFIESKKYDVILNIVDASNIERNLFLTMQLAMYTNNMIIVLNLNKYAKKIGYDIDIDKLSNKLGIPIVPMEAIDDIKKNILLLKIFNHKKKLIKPKKNKLKAEEIFNQIENILKSCIKKKDKNIFSNKLDKYLTDNYFGMFIFFVVMFFIFFLTFYLSEPIVKLLEKSIFILSNIIGSILIKISAPDFFISLINNGIISGIGSVLVFFPSIFILFFSLSLLEDTGYLARIAFIMNNIMSKLGLSGKAFIPLLLGFGCNVPAILSTRTLSKKENRILTMLITPFMSCNARLPVFILIAGALFDKGQPIIIFSLYFLGILIAMISSKLISKILLKNSSSSFIIEFPPYRIPRIKYVLYSAWLKSKDFLKSAGTIIISMVLLIWFFASMPYGVEYASENSLIGILGKFISPIFRPLGFSNWKIAVALIFGFIAKEVIIGTLGTLFKTTNVGGLKSSMSEVFTQPSAISFMVFVLLYVPCLATLSAMKKESGSWKWPIFSVLFSLAIGWIFSFLIYNIINLVILWN